MIVVLVALLVITMLAGLLVQSLVARQRQLRREEQRVQSQFLAESAVERAVVRLTSEVEYTGETWRVPAEEFGAEQAGRTEIRVEPVEGLPNRRRVAVEANYPDDPNHRITTGKQILVDLTPK